MHSVHAVLGALYHRARTGEGQYVHTNIINSGVSFNADYFESDGQQPQPRPKLDKNQRMLGALCRLYQTADAWLQVACMEEEGWGRLAAALGKPALPADPRFASAEARATNSAALKVILEPLFFTQPAAAWQDAFEAAAVPSEISEHGYRDKFFDDPDKEATGSVVRYPMEGYGLLEKFGTLINFSETPSRAFGPPPTRGQHTHELLTELRYSETEIHDLREVRIIVCPDPAGVAISERGGWPSRHRHGAIRQPTTHPGLH